MTKGKVPSKASYNKTGGGDKPDNYYLNEIENTVVNMIGPTVIHGHEGIMEAEASISFLNDFSDETINLPLENNEFVFFLHINLSNFSIYLSQFLYFILFLDYLMKFRSSLKKVHRYLILAPKRKKAG